MNELEQLKAQVVELKCAYELCRDEKQKLGVMYEEALKKQTELEKRIEFLLGACEAYKYCISEERR